MLDMLRHRFPFLRFERIETPFLKRSSQFTNMSFDALFDPLRIGRASERRLPYRPASCTTPLALLSATRQRLFSELHKPASLL